MQKIGATPTRNPENYDVEAAMSQIGWRPAAGLSVKQDIGATPTGTPENYDVEAAMSQIGWRPAAGLSVKQDIGATPTGTPENYDVEAAMSQIGWRPAAGLSVKQRIGALPTGTLENYDVEAAMPEIGWRPPAGLSVNSSGTMTAKIITYEKLWSTFKNNSMPVVKGRFFYLGQSLGLADKDLYMEAKTDSQVGYFNHARTGAVFKHPHTWEGDYFCLPYKKLADDFNNLNLYTDKQSKACKPPSLEKNPISALNEYCQKKSASYTFDIRMESRAPGKKMMFIAKVILQVGHTQTPYPERAGENKRTAKRRAAKVALENLVDLIDRPQSPWPIY